jgi:quercetin dioxygenase-like cupin family protein
MVEQVSIDDPDGEPHAELFETPRPRTVRLTLEAGRSMPPHTHPESDLLVHVLEGRLTVTVAGEPYDCAAGDLLRLDGRQELAPHAETDTVAVVVFSPRADDDGPAGDDD